MVKRIRKSSLRHWLVGILGILLVIFFLFLGWKVFTGNIPDSHIEYYSSSEDPLSKTLPNQPTQNSKHIVKIILNEDNSIYYEEERTYEYGFTSIGFFYFESEVDISNLTITKNGRELFYKKAEYPTQDSWIIARDGNDYVVTYLAWGDEPNKPTSIKLKYTYKNNNSYIFNDWPNKKLSFFKIRTGESAYIKVETTIPEYYKITDFSPVEFTLSKDKKTLTYIRDNSLTPGYGQPIKITPKIRYRPIFLYYYPHKFATYLQENPIITLITILLSLYSIIRLCCKAYNKFLQK